MAEGRLNSQSLGEVFENGVVYALTLKKVFCDVDETCDNRLLWTSEVEKSVQFGTVSALIENLAPLDAEVNYSYRMCFLAVYRTFTTPSEVLQRLMERFVLVASLENSDNEINCQNHLKTLKSLLAFMKLWLDKYSGDFDNPPSFTELNQLEEFLTDQFTKQTLVLPELTDLHKTVVHHHQKLLSTAQRRSNILSCELCGHSRCSGSEREYELSEHSAQQVAQDLTALTAEVFRSIIPHQCLQYIRHHSQSNSVYKAIHTFNRLVAQVISTVLQATNSKGLKTSSARGRQISHWIDIAQCCRLLKNFSSLKAIVSGLSSSSLYRLKHSWAKVNSDKKTVFKELDEMLSSESNFQTFRDVLDKEATGKSTQNKHSSEPILGVVPYLGTLLTDLTMLHSALLDVNKDGLINFEKRRKEFEILAKLSLYQTAAGNYLLPLNISQVHWLYTSPVLTESESFRLSEELEMVATPSPSPTSSPLKTSPPCQFLVRKSLQLLTVAVSDVTSISRRLSEDLLDESSQDMMKSLPRSSSYQEIKDTLVVRVSLCLSESSSCNYKSILIKKGDHTDSVIRRALEKYDITGTADLYQLYQLITSEREMLIPSDALVYYALDNNLQDTPLLVLKMKK